ncbi:MAG: endoribonuclease MazF [Treponema sp.]|jgi:mRNA interferase MazF|nr:endoribonuclease MazF [Treponema sp.]
MVRKKYVPERGDIVWLNFNPGSGHEQQGKRPAIVISPKEYNEKTGLGLFCPITSKIKNYPFEVTIRSKKINGVVLADQIKSLDWRTREIEFISHENPENVNEIISKINVLMQ